MKDYLIPQPVDCAACSIELFNGERFPVRIAIGQEFHSNLLIAKFNTNLIFNNDTKEHEDKAFCLNLRKDVVLGEVFDLIEKAIKEMKLEFETKHLRELAIETFNLMSKFNTSAK